MAFIAGYYVISAPLGKANGGNTIFGSRLPRKSIFDDLGCISRKSVPHQIQPNYGPYNMRHIICRMQYEVYWMYHKNHAIWAIIIFKCKLYDIDAKNLLNLPVMPSMSCFIRSICFCTLGSIFLLSNWQNKGFSETSLNASRVVFANSFWRFLTFPSWVTQAESEVFSVWSRQSLNFRLKSSSTSKYRLRTRT